MSAIVLSSPFEIRLATNLGKESGTVAFYACSKIIFALYIAIRYWKLNGDVRGSHLIM
jgi:hypothetical protein